MKKTISLILLSLVLLFAAYDRYCITGELKRERYSISVGDTTLQIIRKLKIGQQNEKVLDIRTIHTGKNEHYVQLNENTDLDIIIMK